MTPNFSYYISGMWFRSGFTLVEAMVSIAICSIMLLALNGLLLSGNKVYQVDSNYLQLHQQARQAMERIVREVRESKASMVSMGIGERSLKDAPALSQGGEVGKDLSTAGPRSSASDRLIFSTEHESGIQYYLDGTNLVREYPMGNIKIIAVDIGRLKLFKTGAQLTIELQAQMTSYKETLVFPLIETVRLRNE